MSEQSFGPSTRPRQYLTPEEAAAYTRLPPDAYWHWLGQFETKNPASHPLIVPGTEQELLSVAGVSLMLHELFTGGRPPKGHRHPSGHRIFQSLIDIDYHHSEPSTALLPSFTPTLRHYDRGHAVVYMSDFQDFSRRLLGAHATRTIAVTAGIQDTLLTKLPYGWHLGAHNTHTGGVSFRASPEPSLDADTFFDGYTVDWFDVNRLSANYETNAPRRVQPRYAVARYLKALKLAGHTFSAPPRYGYAPVVFSPHAPARSDELEQSLHPLMHNTATFVQHAASKGAYYAASAIFRDPAHPREGFLPSKVSELLYQIFRDKTLTIEQAGLSEQELRTLSYINAHSNPPDAELVKHITAQNYYADIPYDQITTTSKVLGVSHDPEALQRFITLYRKKEQPFDELSWLLQREEYLICWTKPEQRDSSLSPQNAYVLAQYLQALRRANSRQIDGTS